LEFWFRQGVEETEVGGKSSTRKRRKTTDATTTFISTTATDNLHISNTRDNLPNIIQALPQHMVSTYGH